MLIFAHVTVLQYSITALHWSTNLFYIHTSSITNQSSFKPFNILLCCATLLHTENSWYASLLTGWFTSHSSTITLFYYIAHVHIVLMELCVFFQTHHCLHNAQGNLKWLNRLQTGSPLPDLQAPMCNNLTHVELVDLAKIRFRSHSGYH